MSVAQPPGSTPFQLDPNASQIWLYLHADGPMAKVGHSHVITTRGLRGMVWLHPQVEHSGCAVELPVAAFVVDDPQERAAAVPRAARPALSIEGHQIFVHSSVCRCPDSRGT